MTSFGVKFFNRSLETIKRELHFSKKLKAYSTPEACRGIKPISLSFNIYDKRKKSDNDVPLIVMHGLFGSKSNWNSLSKAINEITYAKVITVDMRNHGESPHSDEFSYYHLAEDIHSLFKSLGLPKANVMGHSMGGRAAMLFSLLYPGYLEKLIVVDISPVSYCGSMIEMNKYFDAMKSVNLEGVKILSEARKKANEQLSAWIPELEVRQFLLTNLVEQNENFHWRINLDGLEKAYDSIMKFPSVSQCFKKPVLFVGGSKSDYLRKQDHDDILQIFPEARFEYLDTGHWVHAEKPSEFLQLIGTFLKN